MEPYIPSTSSSGIPMPRASVIHKLVSRPGASLSSMTSNSCAMMPPPTMPLAGSINEPFHGHLQQYYQNASGMLQAEPTGGNWPLVRPRPKILRAPTFKSGPVPRRSFVPSYTLPKIKVGGEMIETVVLDDDEDEPQASTSKASAGPGGRAWEGASGGDGAAGPSIQIPMYLVKPRISLRASQHCPIKDPRKNHFVKRSDFLPVPDMRLTMHEIANQPGIEEKINGSKIILINERMKEVVEMENDVIEQFTNMLTRFESRFGQDSKDPVVNKVSELFKRNIARCKVLRDQMSETADLTLGLLEHKPMVKSVVEKYKDTEPVAAKKSRGGKKTSKK